MTRRYFPAVLVLILGSISWAQDAGVCKLSFDGVLCERRISLKEIDPNLSPDWSTYSYLVMELRTSTPQRFALWIYTNNGPRRIEIQPFGENAWLRASIPLQYFSGMDKSGNDLASTINRRTNSFWMSVWGPFGDLTSVREIGLAMQYPLNKPTIEIRSIHLSKTDEGSQFLDPDAGVDQFGQWKIGDWPRKIHSADQLQQELTDEAKHFGSGADFGYDKWGGYQDTTAKATGFFHVEQIDGVWWFVDPDGHQFLSSSSNGIGGFGGGRRGGNTGTTRPADGAVAATISPDNQLTNHRLDSWGMNTGGIGRPNIVFLNWPRNAATTFLGLPDVYSDDFAAGVDSSAKNQCENRKNDPLIIGYFIGNEPPWGNRESEVCDMILAGPDTATKSALKDFLAKGDTAANRKKFVVGAFEKYLNLICTAVKKYDPNHLNLGIRFGGKPADAVLATGRVFDVCSINVYEYDPTKEVERSYRLTGRPILIGEFHFGVPENGLGSGLVQVKDQAERGVAYRYFVEQTMSLPYCLGAHWFTWRDEQVLGRQDGENYNIGMVDSTNRPYAELTAAVKATNLQLEKVHSGKELPFAQHAKASDAGTPSSPWGEIDGTNWSD